MAFLCCRELAPVNTIARFADYNTLPQIFDRKTLSPMSPSGGTLGYTERKMPEH